MRRSLACLLAVCTVLATACSAAPAEDVGTDEAPTTIRLLLFGGPEELEAYTRVAEAFHEVRDDLRVEVATVAKQDDLLARLTAGFAAGSPPDVFLINFRKYGLYAEQGVLESVQTFLDAAAGDGTTTDGRALLGGDDFDLDLDDFFPRPLDAFRFDGADLTCLPQNISSLVTYVNVDLFERAGVDLPDGDWTWEEFLAAAEALTDEAAGVHGIGTSPSLIRLAPMVWSNGGEVVDDDRTPTALTLDTPEAVEAIEFLSSFVPLGVAPDDVEESARDSESRFIEGTLGMFWSSRREVPGFRAAIDAFEWDVVPFPIAPDRPGHDGERVTMLHSDAFCIAASGASFAAWEFVEFALSADGGAPILAESGRTVPSNTAVANSAAFLREDVPPANAQVFLDNAEIVRATPSTASWNEVEKQADDVLEALYYGRIALDEALARLAGITFR